MYNINAEGRLVGKNNSKKVIKLIDEKIYTVIDKAGKIVYANNVCVNLFDLKQGDRLDLLDTEPDLGVLIQRIFDTDYRNFQFDVMFNTAEENSFSHQIEIEKIIIGNEDYALMQINPLPDKYILESKINNFHYAFEYGEFPLILADNNGKITFASRAFEDILNLGLDIIYGNSIASVFSVYFKKERIEELILSLKQGMDWSETLVLDPNDSGSRIFDLKLIPVFPEGMEGANFILTAHDVTYYYYKNKVIEESEKKLRTIINNISDLLLIMKKEGDHIVFENANDNFCNIFDLDKTQINQNEFVEKIDINLWQQILGSISELNSNNLSKIEFNYSRGENIYYRGKITSSISGNDFFYIISLQDISKHILYQNQMQKAYNKEQELSRLKTTFLQNMSHELRTPANAILGYSEIIKDFIENEEYEDIGEIAESLEGDVGRLISLFTKILEFSEVQSGDVQMSMVPINCNSIVESVYKKKAYEAGSKNLSYSIELGDFDEKVKVDSQKLETVLIYLTDNTLKYTDEGSVHLSTQKMGNEIRIEIADSGKGIDTAKLDLLLKPFVQEEMDGHTRHYEGAGLGLTIAYHLIKIMDGEFVVISEPDIGTTVQVSFKIAD